MDQPFAVDDRFSSLLKRHVAFWIDLIIPFLAVEVLSSFLHFNDTTSAVLSWLGWLIYNLESVHQSGSTIGWKLFGWRLVRRDNSTVSFLRIFARLLIFLFTFTGIGTIVAIIFALFTGDIFWWNAVTDTKLIKVPKDNKTTL